MDRDFNECDPPWLDEDDTYEDDWAADFQDEPPTAEEIEASIRPCPFASSSSAPQLPLVQQAPAAPEKKRQPLSPKRRLARKPFDVSDPVTPKKPKAMQFATMASDKACTADDDKDIPTKTPTKGERRITQRVARDTWVKK